MRRHSWLCIAASLILPLAFTTVSEAQAIIVDHNSTDITQVPDEWITAAKEHVGWVYGHTSHGSQLEEGAAYLEDHVDATKYNLIRGWRTVPPQGDPIGLREGYDGGWSWAGADAFYTSACAMLDEAHSPSTVRVFMWSWCGQMSEEETDVQGYLDRMAQLESEYTDVVFVYMTGHTDEWSDATVKTNNDMVRNWVNSRGGVLFDFADMERYLPDGTLYSGTPDDGCPWCQPWCDTHPGYCPSPAFGCSHSHSLLCSLKAQAWWWLSARLAGWPGAGSPIFSDGFESGTTTAWSAHVP